MCRNRTRCQGAFRQSTCVLFFILSLVACCLLLTITFASQLPSLFRGVVVTDSPLGIRVVSVEDASQASLADLRPEDIIVSVNGTEIHSIDEFATFSSALKGRATKATVLVFRNGSPHELLLHLYSYPILRAWGIEFVPEHDIHFAEPQIGLDYWTRLGRGFEDAHQPAQALNAYLNALHNVPTDVTVALKASQLLVEVSQRSLHDHALVEGITSLREAVLIMEQLFSYTLTDEQLQMIKRQLQETLEALRIAAAHPAS